MPSLEKELLMKQLSEVMEGSSYAFFAKFKGISANEIAELRRRLEKTAGRVIVCKNTIARIVLERVDAKAAGDFLDGQVVLTTGNKDPQVVSKILIEFAKDKENFELKGVFLDRQVFQKQYIQELSKLPSRQELLTSVVLGIQAPISGFVLGLGQMVRSLVNVLDRIREKKG